MEKDKLLKKIMCFLFMLSLVTGSIFVPGITPVEKAEAGVETETAEEQKTIVREYYRFANTFSGEVALYVHGVSKNPISVLNEKSVTELAEGEELPSSYSSVDAGYITPVKNQESTNLCWSFAINAAAEAYMIKNFGYSTDIDYSERHIAGFIRSANSANASSNTYMDRSEITDMGETAFPIEPIGYLASWSGLVEEGVCPWGDDQNAPEIYRYQSQVHLQEARYYSLNDEVGIKKAIMENGAVLLYYRNAYHDLRESYNRPGEYYLWDGCSSDNTTGHMVAVVGWDDSFDGYGAWLCKDSYGTDRGNDGYFWLRWYPRSTVKIKDIIGLKFELPGNYDNNNQYDGAFMGVSYTGGGANVFTARREEEICAVGTYIVANTKVDPSMAYTIKIYRNVKGNTDPTNGELAETITGYFPDSGYYTIPLENKVTVAAGETYSVVLETDCYIGHDVYYNGEKGTSFELVDGVYVDLIERDYNQSIKSFTNNVEPTVKNIRLTYEAGKSVVSWDNLEEAEKYGVFCVQDGEEILLAETDENTYKFSDLSCLKEKYTNVYIKAFCNESYGPASKSVVIEKDVFNMIISMQAEEGNGIYLKWNEIPGVKYIVYLDGKAFKETERNECILSGLTEGAVHRIYVSAVVDQEEWFRTQEVVETVGRCLVPSELRVETNDWYATFYWDKVVERDAKYQLCIYTKEVDLWGEEIIRQYKQYDITIGENEEAVFSTELKEWTTADYIAKIRYIRDNEDPVLNGKACAWSEELEFRTENDYSFRNLLVTGGNQCITLTWDRPIMSDENENEDIEIYIGFMSDNGRKIYYLPYNNEDTEIILDLDTEQGKAVFVGLENDSYYVLELYSYAKDLKGVWQLCDEIVVWGETESVPTATPMPTVTPALEPEEEKPEVEGTLTVTSLWGTQFNGEITITNNTNEVIRNWAIGFDMPHEIEQMWNGTVVSYKNGMYIVKNPGYNTDIMPGESRTIGFIAKLETETVTPPSAYYWIETPKKEETEYRLDYKVNSDWGSAYNGQIELTNMKSSDMQDWIIEFDYENTINQFWNAEIVSHEGKHYVVRNMGYNGTIGAGQTITLGFEAKGDKTGSNEGTKNFKLITADME